MPGGVSEEKEPYLEPNSSLPIAHDRQIFLDQQTEQPTTSPSKAPDLFSEFRRGTTNHTPI